MILPFDEIFCLNLAERSDRKNYMLSQFKNLGIQDKITWHTTVKHPHTQVIQDALNTTGIGYLGTPESFNCTREHYTIIKSSYLRGLDHILVLEDDISIISERTMFSKLLSPTGIPRDYDILRVCAAWDQDYVKRQEEEQDLWNLDYTRYWGTGGYALSREGMRYFIDYIDSSYQTADKPFFDTPKIKESGLKLYNPKILPAVFKASLFSSDIQVPGQDTDILRDPKYSQLPIDYSKYGIL